VEQVPLPTDHRVSAVQGGLRKVMGLLHTTLHTLRRADGADVRAERQLGYHIAETLATYFRVHLLSHVAALERRLAPGAVAGTPGQRQVRRDCPLQRSSCAVLPRRPQRRPVGGTVRPLAPDEFGVAAAAAPQSRRLPCAALLAVLS